MKKYGYVNAVDSVTIPKMIRELSGGSMSVDTSAQTLA
jgi:hypothetical protein